MYNVLCAQKAIQLSSLAYRMRRKCVVLVVVYAYDLTMYIGRICKQYNFHHFYTVYNSNALP